MDLGRLGKKLRREVAASPKKAGLLAVAALVALYFWLPLVWGWFAKTDPAANNVAGADGSPTAATTAPPAAVTTGQHASPAPVEQPSWQQITEWIRNDPRTMTAHELTMDRDPFEPPTVKPVVAKVVEQAPPKPPTITPTAAGLVLSSTIIGPQRRIAQISGKTYSIGQMVVVSKSKEATSAKFKIVEVGPRRAVLESEGQRFELSIAEPPKSARIEISKEEGK